MPPSKQPSTFGKDVFKLATGTTIAQAITVLASPLLTRLYGPEAFGLLALTTSIASVVGVVACLRYEFAIMLPKEDREAANLLGLCLLCAAVVSGLMVPVLYLGGDVLLSFLNAPDLAPYLVLVPIFIFINGLFLALNYWNSRTKHFGRLSIAKITNSLTSTGTSIGAGFAGFTTGGSLIGANLAGSSVSTAVLGGQIWRDDHVMLRRSIAWDEMLAGLKRYKKFPLIDSWSALMNTVSWQLPAFLLAAFFSTSVVGYYSLGLRIIQFPMNLIGGAIAQVFFQRASVAYHEGSLSSVTENLFEVLVKLGLFPMLTIAVAGKEIFTVVFGAAWGEAGVYAQILSLWAIVWFLTSPLSSIYSVREKMTLGLGMSALILTTRFLSLLIGGVLGSEIIALALFSISGAITYGLSCTVTLRMAGVSFARLLKTIVKQVQIAAIFLIPVVVVLVIVPVPLVVAVTAAVCLVGYYLGIYIRDPQLRNLVGNILHRNTG